jgi:hypothetical protein
MRAVEADVVAHLAVVEAHTPARRFGPVDPLDKPTAVPHSVGEPNLNNSPLASRVHHDGNFTRLETCFIFEI